MAHLQYMPGDPHLVDQLIYELKSKGIFDQFRKDCIADVDTRPAYQNLRQRVENSVSTFLSRQTWQPDLNKNQLREKLRKHILDGNYLEQGVERIVDQVVNPKVATVFIPKVEDLVYNYLGITRKKSAPETSNGKVENLLPTDLEAVSPGSVKSNDEKAESMEVDSTEQGNKMDVEENKSKSDTKEEEVIDSASKENTGDIQLPSNGGNVDIDKINIPLPIEEIKPETIPSPDNSPQKMELEKIELPKEKQMSIDIPLPNDASKDEKDQYFKPIITDDDDSSSDSSLRRNMSPLTPIRNFNNENSCDAQQAFENDLADIKDEDKKEPSSFRFTIDAKVTENSLDPIKPEKKDTETNLSYQFNNQVNINNFNTPLYEDSSNSNNLQIDYESDANSKAILENKIVETDQNSGDFKKEKKPEEKKSSHKSSHRSRDSHKHSSSKDKRSDPKHSNSRDNSRNDKNKSSKDEIKSKPSDKDKSKEKNDKKDSSRDSSRHRSSHKSSHRDSKSHRSSSSSGRHSNKHSDEKKSSSSTSVKDRDKTSEKSKDSKSSSQRSDKDKKSSSTKNDKNIKSKNEEKDKEKKNKKENDDHYSVSGRGNPNRRSTDRDSNDGSSSSKGSHNPSNSKSSNSKKGSKSSSKSESTSTSGDSTSPSDKENIVREHGNKTRETLQHKPIVRIESHLETPVTSPPRLPFVPDVTIKKPKFAANFEEAKRLMKMRKFLDEEQKRMNQEAALLLEFQANVRPSMSQVYSSIPGPELEFACVNSVGLRNDINSNTLNVDNVETHYTNNELLTVLNDTKNDEGASIVFNNNMLIENTTDVTNNIETVTSQVDNNETDAANDEVEIKESFNNNESDNVAAELNAATSPRSNVSEEAIDNNVTNVTDNIETSKQVEKRSDLFEITIITEELSENEEDGENDQSESSKILENSKIDEIVHPKTDDDKINGEIKLHYFAEHEKYNAELERARFTNFFKEFNENCTISNKIHLVNCGTYEQSILRDVSSDLGDFEFINYHKNGHLKPPKVKNVIKNVNISTEISLPVDNDYDNDSEHIVSNVFSPEKSECSFELSSDYDTKLEEMVNRTSRQEIMEIILGNVIDSSPSKMPRIDYFTDSNIDSDYENNLKRKISDETSVNNNRPVLTSNKIRKLSTDQITSTTQDTEERSNTKIQTNPRSKYLGKAKRVGLSRPRRTILPNSPSSDKSVENYEENSPNTPQTPNGKIRRSKVQRYDTSDLYKPKLHYLSRRNHIT